MDSTAQGAIFCGSWTGWTAGRVLHLGSEGDWRQHRMEPICLVFYDFVFLFWFSLLINGIYGVVGKEWVWCCVATVEDGKNFSSRKMRCRCK